MNHEPQAWGLSPRGPTAVDVLAHKWTALPKTAVSLTTSRWPLLFVSIAIAAFAASCGGKGEKQTTPSAALIERGEALYQESCSKCHGGATGGSLKDFPPPHNSNGHTWHHPDQQLIEMVLNGITFSVEDQKMPAFREKLTEDDIRAVLAYIKTWWTEEQRQWQATVTAQASKQP